MLWGFLYEKVAPGTHIVLVTRRASASLPVRAAGFEVRDSILALSRHVTATMILYRKPLDTPIAYAVSEHRVGGLNIDGTRVAGGAGYEEEVRRNIEAFAKLQSKNPGWKNSSTYAPNVEGALKGRWPPNAVLIHEDGCRKVGTERVKAPVINRFDDGMKPFGDGAGHTYTSIQTGDADGMEEVDVWSCLPECPAAVMDAQRGASRFFPSFNCHGDGKTLDTSVFGPWVEKLVARFPPIYVRGPDWVALVGDRTQL